jgi:hypothetical protein
MRLLHFHFLPLVHTCFMQSFSHCPTSICFVFSHLKGLDATAHGMLLSSIVRDYCSQASCHPSRGLFRSGRAASRTAPPSLPDGLR